MNKKSKFAITATSLTACMHRADELFAEALRRIYGSHVERAQMRFAPIKLAQDRRSLSRDQVDALWSNHASR